MASPTSTAPPLASTGQPLAISTAASMLSASVAEAVHVFGQLPTTFSLGLLLNAMPSIDRWLREGRRRSLLVGVLTIAATTAGHHVTTLFGSVFFLGPVVARVLIDDIRAPLPDDTSGHRPAERDPRLPAQTRRSHPPRDDVWRLDSAVVLLLARNRPTRVFHASGPASLGNEVGHTVWLAETSHSGAYRDARLVIDGVDPSEDD